MSKCGICGNDLLTGDLHWTIGICNNCYNKIYKVDEREREYVDMLHKETGELLVNLLAEKDKQIAELQKQLEEKEKDNQFFKKMYLSEKQKNDNYHTKKYALDKPVEELRKIKLTPKEKEIYYKGFDNCERQFATHIAELQQQLEEKNKQLRAKIGNMKSTDFIKMCISCGFLVDAKVVDNQDKISFAIAELEKIKDDLLDISSPYWQYFKSGNAFMTYEDIEQWVKEFIDNKIKELKK